MVRAQARVYRATGLRPVPMAVYLVPGRIECGDSVRAVGCANRTTGEIWLSAELSGEPLERVCVHELLHLLGADHVRPGWGIMAARVDDSVRWLTEHDIAAACVLGCPWERPER